MPTTLATRQHPKSGETYAVAIDELGNIVKAAGPLAYDDRTDEDALDGWLSNHFETAEADGTWLEAEFAKARA